jgi:hypothetical protein
MDEAFLKAGLHVDIASPGGVTPTMDKRSLDPNTVGKETAERMRRYLAENADRVEKPMVLVDVDKTQPDELR